MFIFNNLPSNFWVLKPVCDATKTMEVEGQSHHKSRAGLSAMPSHFTASGRPRSGHDRWPDQRSEVGGPLPQC